jgi:hypothetical protein
MLYGPRNRCGAILEPKIIKTTMLIAWLFKSGQADFYWLILNMAAEHSAAIVRNRRGTILKCKT